jgi:hypothetical protein
MNLIIEERTLPYTPKLNSEPCSGSDLRTLRVQPKLESKQLTYVYEEVWASVRFTSLGNVTECAASFM